MARAGDPWADVGWHEEERDGWTWQQSADHRSAMGAVWLAAASMATSLVAGLAWPFTTWPSGLVLAVAGLSAALGVLALVQLRRRRVRHLVALVVAVVAAANGVATLALLLERLVVLGLG